MSQAATCPLPETVAPPRVVIELAASGALVAECHINGQRYREALPAGDEIFVIRELLSRIRRERERQAEAAAQRREAEVLSRHRRVWQTCAERPGQGPAFANRVIGPRNSLTAEQAAARQRVAFAKALAEATDVNEAL